jgi:hypothetical protein
LFSLSSCQEWLDINSDPSFPQEAPAEVLLPPIFQEMLRGDAFDSRYFGCYVQNWANTSASNFADLHGYVALSDALGEKWRQHYWSIGKNIDLMIDDGTANGKWWSVGVAYAIRAWSWQTSTDVYGEMILKQAWEPNRYTFDYDTQDLIYEEVVRLCNLAIENLDKADASGTLAKGDLAYGGDAVKWKKFVNAILARNAHHLSNKTSYNPDAVIAFADAAMASNTDNFYVPHAGTNSDNANFFGPLRANMGVYRQSDYAIRLVRGGASDIFPGVVDPRMALIFQASGDGQYRGLVNGTANTLTGTQAIPTPYGKYIFGNASNVPLFTYAEMQFIKAEAAFKKGDLATALTAYKTGIGANMDYVGVSAANRDTYLLSSAVAQTTGALTLSRIMVQKYIAMYGHGILETWVDMRRHHYDPAVYTGFTLPAILASTNNGIPAYRARPRYNSEYVWNIKALEAIGATNLDYHTYEPWFSKP